MTLFITESELYDLLRLDKVNGPGTVRSLEHFGFPKPEPPFKLRYRALVQQWLDDFHKVRLADGRPPTAIDGKVNHEPTPRAVKAAQARIARDARAGMAAVEGDGGRGNIVGGVVDRGRPRLHAKDGQVVARSGRDDGHADRGRVVHDPVGLPDPAA